MTDAAVFATATAPLYPGPDPRIDPPRRVVVPPGAVDCHCHVIGLPPAYPLVDERVYTVPAALPDRYLTLLDALGMTYGVLIQASVHGTDNSLLVDALQTNSQRLRGIAVVRCGRPCSIRRHTALRDRAGSGPAGSAPRPDRSISDTPISFSRSWMWRVSAGWAMPIAIAAFEKPPWSQTAKK